MGDFAQLERDYQKARERGARPELLKKLENQITRLKVREIPCKGESLNVGDKRDVFQGVFGEDTSLPPLEMFQKAKDELRRRYKPGTKDYIQEHYPDLYQRTNEAQNRLSAIWQAFSQGLASSEKFREALEEWFRLHLQEIEIFAKSNQ